jgi:hypothetical protein
MPFDLEIAMCSGSLLVVNALNVSYS